MMKIDTSFYLRCIQTLEMAHGKVQQHDVDSVEFELFRSACVKEFEIILEQSGKLLRKCLAPYFHSSHAVKKLVFKDLFRYAAQHGLIEIEQTERWLTYRDHRNSTAHDYGREFADKTLKLLEQFIVDAKALETVMRECDHD